MRNKSWQKFEDLVCTYLIIIDKYIRPTKGSGNNTEKHDIKTSCGLAIECKERNIKSVYNEEWMKKIIQEVPLHSQDMPILITRNNDNKMRVHLDMEDFFHIYVEYYKLKGEQKWKMKD